MFKNLCVGCDKEIRYKIFTDDKETEYYCTKCILSCCDCGQTFVRSENNAKCNQCKKEMCFDCVKESFDYFVNKRGNIKEKVFVNPVYIKCKDCRYSEKIFCTEKRKK